MLYKDTIPHQGFQILRKWCQSKQKGHFVFTSNVDNQFQKAGFHKHMIVECHGSLFHLQNTKGTGSVLEIPDDWTPELDYRTLRLKSPLPTIKSGLCF